MLKEMVGGQFFKSGYNEEISFWRGLGGTGSTVVDCMVSYLGGIGYTGTPKDMLLSWLQSVYTNKGLGFDNAKSFLDIYVNAGLLMDNTTLTTSGTPAQLTGDFKIEITFRTGNDVTADQVLVNAGETTPSLIWWIVYIHGGCVSYRDFNDSGSVSKFTDLILIPNKLYNLIIKRSGTTVSAILNNVTSSITYTSGALNLTNTGQIVFGYQFNSTTQSNFGGIISNCKITSLGAVVHWWKFSEGTGTNVSDSVGSNSGTLTTSDFWLGPSNPIWTRRIERIGDSTTVGLHSTDGNGYVKKLSDVLGNHIYRQVGPNSTASTDNIYEKHMAATSGRTTGQINTSDMTTNLTYITTLSPAIRTIVLIHAGTNDVDTALNLDTAVANIAAIIAKIVAQDPLIYIYVSTIIPQNGATHAADVPTFNSKLVTEITTEQVTNSRLFLVDMYSTFTADASWATDYMFDTLHPNDTGYALMGKTFANAILINSP